MKLKTFAFVALILLLGTATGFGLWLKTLAERLQMEVKSQTFLPPTTFFAAPQTWSKNTDLDSVLSELQSRGYSERNSAAGLLPGEFFRQPGSNCQSADRDPEHVCVFVKVRANSDPQLQTRSLQTVHFEQQKAQSFFAHGEPTDHLMLEPETLAQFIGSEPLQQKYRPLGEIPIQCTRAVLAVEDDQFLEHPGVSWTGLLRAVKVNLLGGRSQQGGSTITQQLVKNRFLSAEKTFRRKWIELWMSLVLEFQISKDQILETYLNIIYMGQNGIYQVRGFPAASEHYFGKPISSLTLGECASLAALLNSPGMFDPWKNPGKLLQRRQWVLNRMEKHSWASVDEIAKADQEPLTAVPVQRPKETLPYAMEFVRAELSQLSPPGATEVYTALDPKIQTIAQRSLVRQIEHLEKTDPQIQKLKAQGNHLEGLALVVDLKATAFRAVVGGRSYRTSQFNRALLSKRQVGSLMKPFVFLQAIAAGKKPTDRIDDTRFTHTYDKQSWSPENYGNKYFGEVPLYFALSQSLNSATAKLSLELGMDGLIEMARKTGATSPLQALPSLSLGAFELSPLEVAEMYATLANWGEKRQLRSVRGWVNAEGEKHLAESQRESVLNPNDVAVVVSMMQETINGGTAAAVRALGWDGEAAGKTGTTSEFRDSWFAGFSSENLVLVWLGYDNNLTSGLTGGRGAVPIWVDIMKSLSLPAPFAWPDGVVDVTAQDPRNPERKIRLKEKR